MDGLVLHAVANITNLDVGEVQAHARGYLTDRSIYKSLADPAALLAAAREHGIGAAPRRLGDGLIAVGNQIAGALFWGIEPRLERSALTLAQHVAEGTFLPDGPARDIVLGRQLARSLGARVGSEASSSFRRLTGRSATTCSPSSGILQSADDDDRSRRRPDSRRRLRGPVRLGQPRAGDRVQLARAGAARGLRHIAQAAAPARRRAHLARAACRPSRTWSRCSTASSGSSA